MESQFFKLNESWSRLEKTDQNPLGLLTGEGPVIIRISSSPTYPPSSQQGFAWRHPDRYNDAFGRGAHAIIEDTKANNHLAIIKTRGIIQRAGFLGKLGSKATCDRFDYEQREGLCVPTDLMCHIDDPRVSYVWVGTIVEFRGLITNQLPKDKVVA